MNLIRQWVQSRGKTLSALEKLALKEPAKGTAIEITLRADAEFCGYMSTRFYSNGTSNAPGTKIIGYFLEIGSAAEIVPDLKTPLPKFIDISFTLAEPKDIHTGGIRVYESAILDYKLKK
jgi:hypothetical protein